MISLVLECIDRLHVYSSAAYFAEAVGREAGEAWSSILNSLYQLLGIHTHTCGRIEMKRYLKPDFTKRFMKSNPITLNDKVFISFKEIKKDSVEILGSNKNVEINKEKFYHIIAAPP